MKSFATQSLLIISIFLGCDLFSNEESVPEIPGKLVYSAPDKNGRYQIYTSLTNGSKRKQLTQSGSEQAEFFNPSWSNDGSQIAFTSTLRSTSEGSSLYLMNADGSNIRPLKERPNTEVVTLGDNPVWSPDDSKIAYDWCTNCELGGNNYEIYVYDFETDEIEQLTNEPSKDFFPKWATDNEIFFISNREYYQVDSLRSKEDIYVHNLIENNSEKITNTSDIGSFTFKPFSTEILVRPSNGDNAWYYRDYVNNDSTTFELPISFPRTFSSATKWYSDGNYLLLRTGGFPLNEVKYSFYNVTTREIDDFSESPQLINNMDWF